MIHTHTHILNVILLEFRIDSAIIVLIEALSHFYHTKIQFSKQTRTYFRFKFDIYHLASWELWESEKKKYGNRTNNIGIGGDNLRN